mmetsp:Transcript_2471/g.5690  ORF Transcript_2471/g.5690 Transcript_2471/m.5690 type:complete len:434 (+) Transcript_2471:326-1627(+)|eukprot:CAMPEP_0198334310 /NCGR_PEP_ID=MMETSP1450-20131203/19520_1 /TAXON_ID=753684 ORGANISM="Madagascaria erythrocladiodes, Strain CCMP3234" /NCGR_SAMPLE_ID=MMETSP1450 /ASSEMBLY_ACC=CAM_ASM_001115 /LENGTH=433 /DNA_ID=CAMNT_0044038893 /DNA_START=249 /DNA_END=1550 /DNA_ORIENTATION=-
MKRNTGIVLALAFALCLASIADARRRPRPRPVAVAGAATYVKSCSSASASSTGGSAIAISGSQAKASADAAVTCAKHFIKWIKPSRECGQDTVDLRLASASKACADAAAHVVLNSFSKVISTGGARGSARSCASGEAVAAAFAKTFTQHLSKELDSDCASVYGEASSEALAAVLSKAWAYVFTSANAAYGGSSYAVIQATAQASAGAFALAFSKLAARACASDCSYSYYPFNCGFCDLSNDKDFSVSDSLAAVYAGQAALAASIGEAGTEWCRGDPYAQDVQAKVKAVAAVLVDTCVHATAHLWGAVYRDGWANACAGGWSGSKAAAIASAVAEAWGDAWAVNYNYCGFAESYADAYAFAEKVTIKVANVYDLVCVGPYRGYSDFIEEVSNGVLVKDTEIADAITSAFADVYNFCPCETDICLCNCKTCPLYV